MPRLRSKRTGVVVNVSEETAALLAHRFEAVDEPDEEAEGYQAMKVADLRAELERRNADRDEDAQITVEGTGKNGAVLGKDIVAALEADDAASSDDDE